MDSGRSDGGHNWVHNSHSPLAEESGQAEAARSRLHSNLTASAEVLYFSLHRTNKGQGWEAQLQQAELLLLFAAIRFVADHWPHSFLPSFFLSLTTTFTVDRTMDNGGTKSGMTY